MKMIVVLTGAGISAESGISTFRDSDGLWEHYRVEDVATHEAYERNPGLVLDFYNQRRRQLFKAQPNEAHRQLVRLEERYDVQIVTQNIDDLHERAGSSHVLHLHGELTKGRSDLNPDLIVEVGDKDIVLGDKAPDGTQLRPHNVWFGEAVPNIEPAADLHQIKQFLFLLAATVGIERSDIRINLLQIRFELRQILDLLGELIRIERRPLEELRRTFVNEVHGACVHGNLFGSHGSDSGRRRIHPDEVDMHIAVITESGSDS